MTARYILGALAVLFLVLGATRMRTDGDRIGPAAKTWLLVGTIFALVSFWLWRSG